MKALIVAALLTLFILACESKPPEPVSLGAALPLTGEYEIYGTSGLKGLELAMEEINAAGGVLGGRPLQLRVVDNRTDPGESMRIFRNVVEKGNAVAVFGPVSSVARNAMAEVADELKTPLLYGIDYEGDYYNRYLFLYSIMPDHYADVTVKYLKEQGKKKMYIFGYDYIWPHHVSKGYEDAAKKYGIEVGPVEFSAFGVVDRSATLKRIEESGADILILILPGFEGFSFISKFAKAGLKKDITLVAMAASESYLGVVPEEDLEGVLTPLQFFDQLDHPSAKKFKEGYYKKYPDSGKVTYSVESHYGLMKLLAKAIDKVGSLDKEKIIDAMEGLSVESGSGTVTMREDHHVDLNVYIAEFTGGTLEVVKSFGVVSPPDQRKGK